MVGKIRFHILPDGQTEVQVEGVAGASCEDFSKPFEEALGKVHRRDRTDEYFQISESEETKEKV